MSEDRNPAPAGNQSVQLGIGTLIIIALIVTMCSGKGDLDELRSDTAALKQQVGEINQKLDRLVVNSAPANNMNVEAPAPDAENPASNP